MKPDCGQKLTIQMSSSIRRAFPLAVISIATVLSGCATIFNGSSEQVAIRSNVEGTKLYANEAFVGKTSGVTTFRKKENYVIRASKEGCTDASVPVAKSFDGITLLGIFLDFGIISILIVDGAATGAWQKFDQTSFVIDPVC